MKINPENYISKYTAADTSVTRLPAKETRAAGTGSNYDKAEFTTRFKEVEEKIFSEKLAKSTSLLVFKPKDSESRVSELRQAVNDGTYSVNAREISARILLLGGEE